MFRIAALFLMFFPLFAKSQVLEGRIVRIIDGDAILFETADSAFEVHLYGIDAPDMGQTYFEQTVSHMENYLWNDAVIQLKPDINQERRSAWLFIGRKNINMDLVKNGYAWYDKVHNINAELSRAEINARDRKMGLWKSDNPASPWDFRAGRLAKPPPQDGKVRVLICASLDAKYYHKRYCRQLERCNDNVIVIYRRQAKEIKMKPCKHCYGKIPRRIIP